MVRSPWALFDNNQPLLNKRLNRQLRGSLFDAGAVGYRRDAGPANAFFVRMNGENAEDRERGGADNWQCVNRAAGNPYPSARFRRYSGSS
jgi:hypothetical protein